MNDTRNQPPEQSLTPGQRFRRALETTSPLPIVGTINPYCAMMAERVGHKAIYLAGGGLATYSYGLPDLAMTTMTEVLTEVRRITDASSLPLMIDVDTGFGGAFNIARLIKGLIKDGAAAIHMEDQVQQKRCGHRPNKAVVPTGEMVDRLKAALDARTDASFFICARTDALAVEGLQSTIDRACAYMEAGADMIFAEACRTLEEYAAFVKALNRPHSVLANMTEFSLTPAFTLDELRSGGVSAALFPLSAARAMSAAALKVYEAIHRDGGAKNVIDIMQPRAQLYDFLNYSAYEEKLDQLFARRRDVET